MRGGTAILALADGRIFRGRAFGARASAVGEVVFNTAMTGYQEVLTDPSYKGQMVCMTYPQIGNVGVNRWDAESRRVWVEGFIVKEYCPQPSNWRAETPLDEYLEKWGVVAIEGIDTRALVRHIRSAGAQQAVLSSGTDDADALVAQARQAPELVGRDLVAEVSCREPYDWEEGPWEPQGFAPAPKAGAGAPLAAVIDYGVKTAILRQLVAAGFKVRVFPASVSAREVLDARPDGVFLSNGPGDPAALPYASKTVKELIGRKPIFGICLGHQIIGLALGGETYKLVFGHHGANHPVLDLRTRRVEITAQNHGFAVRAESLGARAELSHVNLNDRTVEGLSGAGLGFFSVQYHPEASPGPHDARYLFGRFRRLVEAFARYGAEALGRVLAEETPR